MTPKCNCLASDDNSLLHYATCEAGTEADTVDNSDVRCLAELAALTDIDTALYCLRQLQKEIHK